MATCAQLISAIETLSSVIPSPSLIVDLTSQVAVVSNDGTGSGILAFTSGGNAVLTIPSNINIDGKMVKLVISGYIDAPNGGSLAVLSGTGPGIGNISLSQAVSSSISSNLSTFSLELDFVWNSSSQQIVTNDSSAPKTWNNVASQSDVQMWFPISFQDANTSDTLTVTQLKLQFI